MLEHGNDIKTQLTQEFAKKLPHLEMLSIITDWDIAKDVENILREDHALLFFQLRAYGTASSEILDILGLGATDKALTLCLAPAPIATGLLVDVAHQLKMAAPGNGIAFTILLSGVSKPGSLLLSEETLENFDKKLERDVEKMKCDASHDLIISIINQGYSEELMDAAKEAGATGGTVIHARRVGSEIPTKFLGIALQEEKEMVLILTEREQKIGIMRAISGRCGLASEARGLVFSLPVDAVMGIN